MKISALKQNAFLIALFTLFLGLQACDPFGVRAKGDLQTLQFDETDFHGLDLCVSGTAEVHVGDSYKVEITCEETAMPYVVTEVENGILKVYFDRNVYDVDHMKIVVTAPEWDHFDVSGSGTVQVDDSISGQTLRLNVSGSGGVHIPEAHFDHADMDVSGSGDLVVAGSAETLDCKVSGSGKIRCFDFLVDIAQVEVSGSGRIEVNVADQLNAEISGSGDIVYKGSPDVNARVSGSGSIKKF